MAVYCTSSLNALTCQLTLRVYNLTPVGEIEALTLDCHTLGRLPLQLFTCRVCRNAHHSRSATKRTEQELESALG